MTTRAEIVERMIRTHPQLLGNVPRAILRNLSVLIDYPFMNGRSFPPKSITFRISGRCNLKCNMCNFVNTGFFDKAQDLPVAIVKEVINQVHRYKPFVAFTGGEPLLHPHIIECVNYVKEKRMSCSLATNGWYLTRYAEDIAKSGLDILGVSIDGPEEINDRIRGRNGVFRRAVEGIREVLRFRKRPLVFINAALQANNYEFIADLADQAIQAGVDGMNIQVLWTRPSKRADLYNRLFPNFSVRDGWSDESLLKINFDVLGEVLTKAKEKGLFINMFPFKSKEQIRTWYTEPARLSITHRQFCPWMFANIYHDGTIRMCDDIILGDLNEEGFWEIWNSARTCEFRRILRQQKNFPICAGCCSLYRDFTL